MSVCPARRVSAFPLSRAEEEAEEEKLRPFFRAIERAGKTRYPRWCSRCSLEEGGKKKSRWQLSPSFSPDQNNVSPQRSGGRVEQSRVEWSGESVCGRATPFFSHLTSSPFHPPTAGEGSQSSPSFRDQAGNTRRNSQGLHPEMIAGAEEEEEREGRSATFLRGGRGKATSAFPPAIVGRRRSPCARLPRLIPIFLLLSFDENLAPSPSSIAGNDVHFSPVPLAGWANSADAPSFWAMKISEHAVKGEGGLRRGYGARLSLARCLALPDTKFVSRGQAGRRSPPPSSPSSSPGKTRRNWLFLPSPPSSSLSPEPASVTPSSRRPPWCFLKAYHYRGETISFTQLLFRLRSSLLSAGCNLLVWLLRPTPLHAVTLDAVVDPATAALASEARLAPFFSLSAETGDLSLEAAKVNE